MEGEVGWSRVVPEVMVVGLLGLVTCSTDFPLLPPNASRPGRFWSAMSMTHRLWYG